MADVIIPFLIQNSITFAALFCAVLFLKKLFYRRLSAAMHLLLWGIVLLKLLLPFSLPSEASPLNLLQRHDTVPNAYEDKYEYTSAEIPQQSANSEIAYGETPLVSVPIQPPASGNADAVQVILNGQPPDPGLVIIAVWSLGIVARVTWLWAGSRNLGKKVRKLGIAPPHSVMQRFERYKKELGIRTDIKVVMLSGLAVPAASGFLNPVLLLPVHLTREKYAGQLRCALIHELLHIKRRDTWMVFLLNVLNAVYWFNPLVWICVRLIRKDMETACDHDVIRFLGIEKRLEYIGAIVRFAGSRREAHTAAALGINDAGRNVERRIRGMFLNPKTKLRVKVPVVALACLMVFACFTTACQPTPEKPPVVNKAEGKLEAKVSASAAPEKKYNAPLEWKEELKREDIGFTVQIVAPISIPDVQKFPVVEIAPANFTQAEIDPLVAYFSKGKPLYSGDIPRTKAQIQDQIVELQAEMKLPEGERPPNGEIEAMIKRCQKEYKGAPEKVDYKPIEGKLKVEPGSNYETLDAFVDTGREKMADISVMNPVDGTPGSGDFCFDDGILYQPQLALLGKQAEGVKLTPSAAAVRVEKVLSDLGISDMHAVRVDTGYGMVDQFTDKGMEQQGYVVTCKRFVEGIPVLDIRLPAGQSEKNQAEPQYTSSWSDGWIYASVDDTGIRSFRRIDYGKTGKILNGNVEMLPFQEIQRLFRQQMVSQFAAEKKNLLKDKTTVTQTDPIIKVDSVELGFVTVKQKDKPGSYALVPAWSFIGREYLVTEEGQVHNPRMGEQKATVFAVINAVDGSTMDRDSGY